MNWACLLRALVAQKLGIEQPGMSWITESERGWVTGPQRIFGYTSTQGEIFIRANLSPFQITHTIAHEVRHCWQQQRSKKLYSSEEFRERDAEIYQLEFWAGAEKRNGNFADITEILTRMQIELCKATIRSTAIPYYPNRSAHESDYPRSGRPMKLVLNYTKTDWRQELLDAMDRLDNK